MNLTYSDGRHVSKPFDAEEFAQALDDPDCVRATFYKPGTTVTMSDRTYKVDSHGSLRRVRPGKEPNA